MHSGIYEIWDYYYFYLLQLSFHSVAVVLTLVQTKQIRINIYKRNNTKTQYKQYKTQKIQDNVAKCLPKFQVFPECDAVSLGE